MNLEKISIPFSFERVDFRGKDISQIVEDNKGKLALVGFTHASKEGYVIGVLEPIDSIKYRLKTIKGDLAFRYTEIGELLIAKNLFP